LLYLERRCFDLALTHLERAIEINPVNPTTKADLGLVLCRIGRAEEGLEHLRDARRTDPYFGPSWYWPTLGVAQFVLRRYEEALADFDRGASRGPHMTAMMAGCCAKLGLVERARELVTHCLAMQPAATVGNLVAGIVFKGIYILDSLNLKGCQKGGNLCPIRMIVSASGTSESEICAVSGRLSLE
jgi:adenylate cyclase